MVSWPAGSIVAVRNLVSIFGLFNHHSKKKSSNIANIFCLRADQGQRKQFQFCEVSFFFVANIFYLNFSYNNEVVMPKRAFIFISLIYYLQLFPELTFLVSLETHVFLLGWMKRQKQVTKFIYPFMPQKGQYMKVSDPYFFPIYTSCLIVRIIFHCISKSFQTLALFYHLIEPSLSLLLFFPNLVFFFLFHI